MTQTLLKPAAGLLQHRLANGLTIIAQQMPIEAVSFGLWVHAGSAVETDGINGMAHFLEHMIFKGSPLMPSGEFERRVEQRGGVTNAATSQDYTFYYVTIAPQDFAAIAPWQIDIVLNASLPDPAFERERLVILEEIRRSEDHPRRRVFQQAMALAFTDLPYRRPVLGPTSVIEQLHPQQMRDFHRRWYQPQAMTAVAVGNLPAETLVAGIATGFKGVAAQPLPTRAAWGAEPPFREIVRQELVDPTLSQARLVMLWRVPGMAQLEATYPLDILAHILGQGRTSRLVQDLREDRKLVSSLSVSNMVQELQGLLYISVQLPTEHLAIVETAIAEHLRRLQNEAVSTTELAQIQRQTISQFVFRNETPSSRAGLYGYYQMMAGDLTPALHYPEHIQTVTLAELQQAAQQYLAPDAYGLVIVKPSP